MSRLPGRPPSSQRRVGRFVFVPCTPDAKPWEAVRILHEIGLRGYVAPPRVRPEEEIACPS